MCNDLLAFYSMSTMADVLSSSSKINEYFFFHINVFKAISPAHLQSVQITVYLGLSLCKVQVENLRHKSACLWLPRKAAHHVSCTVLSMCTEDTVCF